MQSLLQAAVLQNPCPHESVNDAGGIAVKHELPVWINACPAVHEEKETLVQALPAAWIVAMSDDPVLIGKWLPEIINAIQWFDYDKTYYGAFFFAENAIWELLQASAGIHTSLIRKQCCE